ncbi:hypothetical protein TNIN_78371 [Trichonephila inaurata madagascariensis]|uniref:Uncharacterized protein n=1 Tax=Trichonephila inaurata madagascariensis TaxID=2747483 RepID=A0A8X6WX63_9ARAC|nr:hypothetical protein TNIN_78371 [Trichonephila inaurata madagascariensis]
MMLSSTILFSSWKANLSITGNKLALYGLPEPVHDQPELTSKDVLRETSYDVQALRAYMAANVPRLTASLYSHLWNDREDMAVAAASSSIVLILALLVVEQHIPVLCCHWLARSDCATSQYFQGHRML